MPEKYVFLSKHCDVRLAGRFLVIKSGQSQGARIPGVQFGAQENSHRKPTEGRVKKKILIVEDNNDCREILGLFVTKLGHQPIKACNSKKAITSAEVEPFWLAA
jgi:hypothetical protein